MNRLLSSDFSASMGFKRTIHRQQKPRTLHSRSADNMYARVASYLSPRFGWEKKRQQLPVVVATSQFIRFHAAELHCVGHVSCINIIFIASSLGTYTQAEIEDIKSVVAYYCIAEHSAKWNGEQQQKTAILDIRVEVCSMLSIANEVQSSR